MDTRQQPHEADTLHVPAPPSRMMGEPTVLLRTDLCLAVDKPAGILVHGWSSHREEDEPPTLVELLSKSEDFGKGHSCVHLVNRLDKWTSGVLLVGRTPSASAELQGLLSAERTAKVYITMTRGLTEAAFTVNRALRVREPAVANKSSSAARRMRKKLQQASTTQDAITDFVRLATCCDGHCSVLVAMPRTGRHHQIRRHLDGLRHSVSGDTDYGPSGINTLLRERYGLTRLFLHSAALLIDDSSAKGCRLRAVAPLPSDLRSALTSMEGGAEALLAIDALLGSESLAPQLDDSWIAAARLRCAAGTTFTTTYRALISKPATASSAAAPPLTTPVAHVPLSQASGRKNDCCTEAVPNRLRLHMRATGRFQLEALVELL